MIRVALIAVLLVSCYPKRQIVKVETIRRSCIDQPAPVTEPITLAGPEDGCPAEFEFCASPDAAGSIDRYLRATEKWMRQTVIACASHEGENDENEND